jgi:L-amino acid N-acyltransferase YncA
MHHAFHIRAARPADAAPLARLLNAIIHAGGTTAMEDPFTDQAFADYFLTGSGVLSCFVAEAETGEAIGFQAVCRYDGLPEGWGDIATFARREPKIAGVGRALFPSTVRAARQRSLVAINAAIRADNTGGLAYYEKIGFATYDRLAAVPLRDGTPVDRILKRYDLA